MKENNDSHFFTKIMKGPTALKVAKSEIYDLAEWLERLTANAKIAIVLGSIPASSNC
jgi:hypothetical protein